MSRKNKNENKTKINYNSYGNNDETIANIAPNTIEILFLTFHRPSLEKEFESVKEKIAKSSNWTGTIIEAIPLLVTCIGYVINIYKICRNKELERIEKIACIIYDEWLSCLCILLTVVFVGIAIYSIFQKIRYKNDTTFECFCKNAEAIENPYQCYIHQTFGMN